MCKRSSDAACSLQANALARWWAPLGSSYHAEGEADNNGEARLLIVCSSDEISHDDR
jgi:hypothetical protein